YSDGWPDYMWVPYSMIASSDQEQDYINPYIDINWIKAHLLVPGGLDDPNSHPTNLPTVPPASPGPWPTDWPTSGPTTHPTWTSQPVPIPTPHPHPPLPGPMPTHH
ncbi:MAG: hypothetical protein ACXWP5_13060, partial [Bdellovibrionota bacterium]